MKENIPFNQPFLAGKELEYIQQAINFQHISGDGVFTKKCHRLLESLLAAQRVLLTTSCTHALEMAALLLNIRPGDEVILPSFTFVSTVNAFLIRGACPVFIDIRPDTLNMDESLLEPLLTRKSKVIVPVHYAGVGCEMDAILKIAERYKIAVVEDNAHGLFGKYKGKNLGTFGCFGAQSFHETKNFICGEGGALIINDLKFLERAEVIREKGTNRSRFFRGEIDKYTWVDIGSSYLPSDILSAFLFAQLEAREVIQEKRKRIWNFYFQNLSEWALRHEVKLPFVPTYCEQPYHMFYMILPNLKIRQAMIDHLKTSGIHSVFHYLPLHLSEIGRKFGSIKADCKVSEDVSDRLVRLPFYSGLSEDDQNKVVAAICKFEWT